MCYIDCPSLKYPAMLSSLRSSPMIKSQTLSFLLPILFCGGCLAIGGVTNTQPTMGQQMIDLKAARDSGAMTDHEYEMARQSIVASPNSALMTAMFNAAANQESGKN